MVTPLAGATFALALIRAMAWLHNPRRLIRALSAGLLALCASAGFAQQPACVATPEVGRSCVDMIVVAPAASSQSRTGAGSFVADDEPGNDSSGINHVIRSLDLITYEIRYRVLNQDANGLRLRFTLPAELEYANPSNPAFGNAPIPDYCLAGSTLTGPNLDCQLGNVSQGIARSALLYARPRFGTPDGAVVRLQATVEASNQQTSGSVQRIGYQDPTSELPISCNVSRLSTTQTLSPCGDVVSARPQFDLEMGGFSSTNLADRSARGPELLSVALSSSIPTVVGGAPGRSGFVVSLPVAIALPGDGSGGAPLNLSSPINLGIQLSNNDALSGFGELVGCGVNGNDDPVPNGTRLGAGWAVNTSPPASIRARRFPYGTIGLAASTSVDAAHNSGQMNCTQSVAGGDIGITIQPTASTFAPPSFATRNVDGTATARRYVFVGVVVLFYPVDRVLPPSSGGTGDGSVGIRFNIGQSVAGGLQGLTLNGVSEPDAVAINNGFSPVGTFDDDNNNFVNSSLDSVGATYAKLWRNPRADTDTLQGTTCLRDGTDPICRHGYAFPGANIQSLFIYNYRDFIARSNVAFCDEWDSARTRLRVPFDPLANPTEMPPGNALILELGGLNGSPGVLASMGLVVEVSTDAGTVPNIDWQPNEPERTLSRSQASAPECSSGNWSAASLPTALIDNLNPVSLPSALESPPGSGIYPTIKRIRVRAASLPPFVTIAVRGSYEVTANVPGVRLPNRTSFQLEPGVNWTYAENDHAIVRSVDTSITLTASRNLSTGAVAPISVLGFGETAEFAINTKLTSGEVAPIPLAAPLTVKSYLPNGLGYVSGSAHPPLFSAPYSGINPETGQSAEVLEWRFANPVPGGSQPPITYQVRLSLGAGNGAALHTTATVEHELDPTPLITSPLPASNEDRIAVADITARVPPGLLTTLNATTPFIDLGGVATWQLGIANTTDATFSSLRIISPVPRVGDVINSANAFSGAFSSGTVSGITSGVTLYYTTSAATRVNRNPNCVSNGGTLADGSAACPAAGAVWTLSSSGAFPAGTTSIRIDDTRNLAPNASNSFVFSIDTEANRAGDAYEFSFTATALGQSLVVQSPRALIRVPSAEIRGAVFSDNDDSHTPTSADTGIPGVTMTLSGRDAQGNTYVLTAETVAASGLASTLNRVSINGGAPQAQTCSATPALQRGEYLFCNLPSSNAAGYQLFEQQPVDYLDREDFVGSLTSGQSAGVVSANDTISGIRIQNDLVTGAGDRGSAYLFAEFPIYAIVRGRVVNEQSVPLNQIDDGQGIDPGISTLLSIACSPATMGSATVQSAADGSFEFALVPVGANCTITETQPAGYLNLYNLLGGGAFAQSGNTGSGASTISLVVPARGSDGNVFGELQLTDTTSTVVCDPTHPVAGQIVTCTATCTNHGPGVAANMACEITNRDQFPGYRGGLCASQSPVAPGDYLTCRIQFQFSALVTEVLAGSGATNDTNGGTLPTAGNNPSRISLLAVQAEPQVAPVPLGKATSLLLAALLMFGAMRRSSRLRSQY